MPQLFSLTCPNCGGKLEKTGEPGTTVPCDYCSATIALPEAAPEAPAAPLEEPTNWIAGKLAEVEQAIDALPDDLQTDKARLKEAARKVWLHAQQRGGGWMEETSHESNYLVREAKSIFDLASGFLLDGRSEVKDFVEPILTQARQSADVRPIVETVQSFGQAMAESQGRAIPDDLNQFSAPFKPPFSAPSGGSPAAANKRPIWQIAVGAGIALLCLCCCGAATVVFLLTNIAQR